jgi:hypothetical protein
MVTVRRAEDRMSRDVAETRCIPCKEMSCCQEKEGSSHDIDHECEVTSEVVDFFTFAITIVSTVLQHLMYSHECGRVHDYEPVKECYEDHDVIMA